MLRRLGYLLVLALALVFCLAVPSDAALVPARGGVIHACLLTKGEARGTIRVVSSPRGCRRARGERPLDWNASGRSGADGAAGSAGATGPEGPRGLIGPEGARGLIGPEGPAGAVGEVEQALEETIEDQSTQIEALQHQVTALGAALLGVEGTVTAVQGTVAKACTQLGSVSTQVNKVASAVGGITLLNALNLAGLGLAIPPLPPALTTEGCK
jgi:hypothetical protein